MAWSRNTSRRGTTGSARNRKIAGGAALAVAAAAAFAVATGTGQAAENCQGLDTALRNNLTFIAAQRQNPDANSAARIANRQAVVDLIQQRRAAAGCTAEVQAGDPAQPGNGGQGNAGGGQAGNGGQGRAGATENCQGLDTALRNNLTFIAAQRQNPDANSAARIANRQAVVDLIQQRRAAAGCTAEVVAGN
ncbi:hypothetical protein ACGFI9_25115 [Micromonospora sp. NPDC048930]|uniref:hypothetical protein n=1 Tax=Micromonospora sp. NPDC048930 TaxID=3364261 RepID=UPI00371B7BAD